MDALVAVLYLLQSDTKVLSLKYFTYHLLENQWTEFNETFHARNRMHATFFVHLHKKLFKTIFCMISRFVIY